MFLESFLLIRQVNAKEEQILTSRFTPQPLGADRVLFSAMVSGPVGGRGVGQ